EPPARSIRATASRCTRTVYMVQPQQPPTDMHNIRKARRLIDHPRGREFFWQKSVGARDMVRFRHLNKERRLSSLVLSIKDRRRHSPGALVVLAFLLAAI